MSYAKVKPQIVRLCRQDAEAWVTTLFDLYALPTDFPGKAAPAKVPAAPAKAKVDDKRRGGKMTISQALSGDDGSRRGRSMAAAKRSRSARASASTPASGTK